MGKTFWITDSRFKFIALLLILIFFVFMMFLFMEAEAIKKDPCAICSEKMGDEVTCTTGGFKPLFRTYFPNGSIESNE